MKKHLIKSQETREELTRIFEELMESANTMGVLRAAAHGLPDFNQNIQANMLSSIESFSEVIYSKLMDSVERLRQIID